MRRLPVMLDDKNSDLLAKYPNQSRIVRDALDMYFGDITTDTKEGLRLAFVQVRQSIGELKELLQHVSAEMDKLSSKIPSREF